MKLNAVVALACACVLSVGLALTSFAGVPVADTDGDTVQDNLDNCVATVNPGQRDDNADGFGNLCDADVDDSCIIGLADLGLVGGAWGESGPPWTNTDIASYDVDISGVVGLADLGIVGGQWGGKPGASGLACAQDCSGAGPFPPPPTTCFAP